MNLGADAAGGDIFWFLHADAEVPLESLNEIARIMRDPEVCGGFFRIRLPAAPAVYRLTDGFAHYAGLLLGCDAAIMEFSAGEERLLTLGDFQTCRSWKTWNFFGDFADAVASCIATNEFGRAHVAMKQWDRHASHLPTDRLRRFIFSVSPCPRWPAFTVARVVLRTSRRFCQNSAHRRQFNQRALVVRANTLPVSIR